MQNLDMFGNEITKPEESILPVMPVSVIDIAPHGRRKNEDHSKQSSRENYSPFPLEVCDLCYTLFLRDCELIVDPFAGWGERHAKAIEHGKEYIGFDISEESIHKANEDWSVFNIEADSRNVDIPKDFDGMITCPPYWNLELYGSNEGIDKEKTWGDFLSELRLIFSRFYDAAKSGATFCVMVGDWRKNHVFYDLDYEASRIFKELGAIAFDRVVISRKTTSKIKIMLPQAKRLGYTVRVHESLLVFRKP